MRKIHVCGACLTYMDTHLFCIFLHAAASLFYSDACTYCIALLMHVNNPRDICRTCIFLHTCIRSSVCRGTPWSSQYTLACDPCRCVPGADDFIIQITSNLSTFSVNTRTVHFYISCVRNQATPSERWVLDLWTCGGWTCSSSWLLCNNLCSSRIWEAWGVCPRPMHINMLFVPIPWVRTLLRLFSKPLCDGASSYLGVCFAVSPLLWW